MYVWQKWHVISEAINIDEYQKNTDTINSSSGVSKKNQYDAEEYI